MANKYEQTFDINTLDKTNRRLEFTAFDYKWSLHYTLSEKGNIAISFNEINPIIITNHMDKIFENKNDVLPILSMFIDGFATSILF